MASFISNLLGNKHANDKQTTTTTTASMGPTSVLNTQVHEQHVQQAQSAGVQEKHIVQEQHITREQPILEKTVVHQQPIVQQKTIVHEKPIIHEKTTVHRQQQVVQEAPIVQQAAAQKVQEAPSVIKEAATTVQEQAIVKGAPVQNLSSSSVVREQIVGQTAVLGTQVREQHVQQTQPAAIQEKHIIQEQHITREQPIIERTVVHQQPIVQQQTVVHEKPIIHDKTTIHKQQEIVHEQPIFKQAATQKVQEAASIVKEAATTVQEQAIVRGAPAQNLSSSSVVREQLPSQVNVLNPQVREQHVLQQGAASLQQKHVVQEQHIVREQPILEKTVVHQQPIVQQQTIVHEKPIIHEKMTIHKQQEIVHEKPIYQAAAAERVVEAPTVIREGTTYVDDVPSTLPTRMAPIVQQQSIPSSSLHSAPLAAAVPAAIAEPTLLHETVSGSAVYDKSKHTNATTATLREDALRHQTDMNQALAGENDRIAANLKAAAAERERLAAFEAAKAPGTAKVGKHTSSA